MTVREIVETALGLLRTDYMFPDLSDWAAAAIRDYRELHKKGSEPHITMLLCLVKRFQGENCRARFAGLGALAICRCSWAGARRRTRQFP